MKIRIAVLPLLAAVAERPHVKPIMDWLEENERFLFQLEMLLGNVRKIEKSTEGRFYISKTDVLDEIWNKEEAYENQSNIR